MGDTVMTARCISTTLSTDQRRQIGASEKLEFRYDLTEGKTYLVVAITFVCSSPVFGTTVLFDVVDETDYLMPIPACLFEIMDDRGSMYWRVRRNEDGSFTLWPESFYKPCFHDLLSDRDPDALAILHSVLELMNAENSFDASEK
jgi:hypothetical protein